MPNRILYASLLTSAKINQLNAHEFELYVRLLLVADDYGRYSGSPIRVARSCWPDREDVTGKTITPMLKKLAQTGLILTYKVDGEQYIEITNWRQRTRQMSSKFPTPDSGIVTNDGQMTVNCQSTDSQPRTETETETETETSIRQRAPSQQVVDLWNETVTSLPAVKLMTSKRRKSVSALLQQVNDDLSEIERTFSRVENSDFLCGRTKDPWTGCGFDWVISQNNWTKIIEGNYDNKTNGGRKPSNMGNFKQREYKDEDLAFLYEDITTVAEVVE